MRPIIEGFALRQQRCAVGPFFRPFRHDVGEQFLRIGVDPVRQFDRLSQALAADGLPREGRFSLGLSAPTASMAAPGRNAASDIGRLTSPNQLGVFISGARNGP